MLPSTVLTSVLSFAKKLLSLGASISSIRRLFSLLCFWPKLFYSASPTSGDPSTGHERVHSKQNRLPSTCASTLTICASVLPTPAIEGGITIIGSSSPSAPRMSSPRSVRRLTSRYEYSATPISSSFFDTAHDIDIDPQRYIMEPDISAGSALTIDTVNDGDIEPKYYTVERDISTNNASSSNNGTPTQGCYLGISQSCRPTPTHLHISSHNMQLTASPSSRHSLHTPPTSNNNSTESFSTAISSISNASRRSRDPDTRYAAPSLPVPHPTELDMVSGDGGPTGANVASSTRLVSPPNGDRASTPNFTPDFSEVYPLLATHASKETREIFPAGQSFPIPAPQLRCPEHDESLPIGWNKPLQPEGTCYFMHEERRIFTHADICEPDVLDDVMGFADYLQNDPQRKLSSEWYEGIELVIEPRLKEDDTVVGLYYFVSPRDQCVFWLQDHDASPFLDECSDTELLSRRRLAITAQYWKHWELFPNLCHVTEDIIDELRYMLLQARCDHIMSEESTAEPLSQLFAIVDNIRLTNNPKSRVYSASIVGKIMYEFAHNQFLNFPGQKRARLSVLQYAYGENLEQ